MFCSLCSRVAGRRRGVFGEAAAACNQHRGAQRTDVHICMHVEKKAKPSPGLSVMMREKDKRNKNSYGSFVFTSALTVASPQKHINKLDQRSLLPSIVRKKLHKVMAVMEAFMCVKENK